MSQENPLPQFIQDLDVFIETYKSSVSMPKLSTDLKKFIVVHPQIKDKFQSYLDPESPLKVLNCLRLLEFLTINNKEQLLQIIQEEKFGDLFPSLMSLEERMDDILNLLKLWSDTYGDCKTELEHIFNYIEGLENFSITLPPRYQQKFELDDEYEPMQGPIQGPIPVTTFTEMGIPYTRLDDQLDDETKRAAEHLINEMQSLLQTMPSLPLAERNDKIHEALHKYMMFKIVVLQNMNPLTRIALNGQVRLMGILKNQLEIYSLQTQLDHDIPRPPAMNLAALNNILNLDSNPKIEMMEIEDKPAHNTVQSNKQSPVKPEPPTVVVVKELNGKLQSRLLVRTKYHQSKVLNDVSGIFPFCFGVSQYPQQKSE